MHDGSPVPLVALRSAALRRVDVSINRVEVLDDTGPSTKVRSMHWTQHATWGAAKDKREEVRSTAVFTSAAAAHVENLRIKRLDPAIIYLHWCVPPM